MLSKLTHKSINLQKVAFSFRRYHGITQNQNRFISKGIMNMSMNTKFMNNYNVTYTILISQPKRTYFQFEDKATINKNNAAISRDNEIVLMEQLQSSFWDSMTVSKASRKELDAEVYLHLTKILTDPTIQIPFEDRFKALHNLTKLISHKITKLPPKSAKASPATRKSIDPKLMQAHYLIIDFLCLDYAKGRILNPSKRISEEDKIEQIYHLFYLLDSLYITETFYFKKNRSLVTEETMNLFDSYMMYFIENYNQLSADLIVNRVVKSMQVRCRKFKDSINTEKVVEWYFKNVFSDKLTHEQVHGLTDYDLSQLLFNISFLNYDLNKISRHLNSMKRASIERLETKGYQISHKDLVLMISSILRMNLIFLKDTNDLEKIIDICSKRVERYNIIDKQNILVGYAHVFGDYSYPQDMVDPILDSILKTKEPINSLILTSLMKSLSRLRVSRKDIYDFIVKIVKENYSKLDNIALIYTYSRLVRLGQFDHSNELFDLYANKLNLFEDIKNVHNTSQTLLCLATVKNYDPNIWKTLIENSDPNQVIQSQGNSENDEHADCFRVAFTLCEFEAPELYNSLIKDSQLQKKVDNCITKKKLETTKTQSYITNAVAELGYKYEEEYEINGKAIDLYLPEVKLAIEYDGPTHFLNGTDIYIRSSLYSSRLLNGKAKLISIPYFELSKCKDLNISEFFIGHQTEDQIKSAKEYENAAEYMKKKIDSAIKQ